jgi:FkbM family methyltransferase
MRRLIRQLLNKAGYDIIKINEHADSKAGKKAKVQVGKFFIEMPGNNRQISTYKYRPETNNLLGTLSVCVASKYPNVCAVDIGANVGDTIAIIKSAIDIPVIGIEGDPVTFKFLETNTKQFHDVTILKEFLGEKRQTLQVEMEKSGWNTTLIPTNDKGQELSLKTLDEVLEENKLANPDIKILKVDTEGFDTIIIRGTTGLLQKNAPVLFFEYNKTNMDAIGEDGLGTLLSLEKYGYLSAIFFDNYGRYMLSTPLNQHELIRQLHHYSDDNDSRVGYYDICLFHENDSDIAKKFIEEVAPR